jgi:protein gp37
MGQTKIEWTDRTWNPTRGCSRVSEGCRNCYAERMASRFSDEGHAFEGIAIRTPSGPRWTGKVELIESKLSEPLHWKKPQRVFVNSMSDLFHEALSHEAIIEVFAVMALAAWHTFQILTKRPERMFRILNSPAFLECVEDRQASLSRSHGGVPIGIDKPLPNVWLGVSVEDQATADARTPLLLQTPAAIRFVSYEPALGPVDFSNYVYQCYQPVKDFPRERPAKFPALNWIIAGGESGPGARPAHPDWFRSARDQCKAAGVAFFFKQWGEWLPDTQNPVMVALESMIIGNGAINVGKKKAGALLDGREWKEFPK